MRVVVGHHLFASAGGGERVCLTVADECVKQGFHTSIASVSKFSIKEFNEIFGLSLPEVKQYYLLPFFVPYFGIYQKLSAAYPTIKAIKRFKPDAVFFDNEFFKPLEGLKKRTGFRLLHYVHFPLVVELVGRVIEKYRKGIWRYYRYPWRAFYRHIFIEESFADVCLCNSSYTKRFCEEIWDRKFEVLYPPVQTARFKSSLEEKEDLVVCLGRFTPEKRYEDAIEAISRCDPSVKLIIIGALIPAMRPYLIKLEKMVRRLGLEDRVKFVINAPFSTLRRYLSRAKVVLHTMMSEHFGISVVEAMSAGCLPVVHKSGGVYEDIIERGKHGYAFEDVDEIPDLISRALEQYSRLVKRIIAYVEKFDESEFRQRIVSILRADE